MPTCVIPTCKNSAATAKKSQGITFHLFPADEERKSRWTKIIQKTRLDEFWKPSKRSVICSSHFEEQYFYCTKSGLKRLNEEAFPNKNLAGAPEMTETPTKLSGLPIPRIDTHPSSTGSNSEIDDVNNLDLVPGNSNTSVEIPGLSKIKIDIKPELLALPQSEDIKPELLALPQSEDIKPELLALPQSEDIKPELLALPQSDSNIDDVDISDLDYVFDTPKEVKLRSQLHRKKLLCDRHVRKIKSLQQKNRRLVKENASLKSILKNLKDNRYVNPEQKELAQQKGT